MEKIAIFLALLEPAVSLSRLGLLDAAARALIELKGPDSMMAMIRLPPPGPGRGITRFDHGPGFSGHRVHAGCFLLCFSQLDRNRSSAIFLALLEPGRDSCLLTSRLE